MKAALLGIGEPHFDGHLRTLQVLPEIESIALWGTAQAISASRRPLSSEDKVVCVLTDLDALLAQPDIFLAVASVPTHQKHRIFTRVLEAGIHLLAEKPMAMTAAETADLVDTATRHKVQLGVCYTNRHHPLIQQARRLYRQGLLGSLMTADIRLLTTQPKFRMAGSPWMFRQQAAGSGMLGWLGCHYLDMLHHVTGDDIVSVSAEVAVRSGDDIDVEDVAVLSLRFRSGAIGSLHVGYTLALKGARFGDTPVYDHYAGFNGQLGRMYWSTNFIPTVLHAESAHEAWAHAPRQTFAYTLGESPAYGAVWGENFVRDFLQAAQGQGQPPASGLDALRVAHIVEAAYASSRTGRRVDLPSVSGSASP